MTDGPKLGTDFGSFQNWLASHQDKEFGITVGEGCTILFWSDRVPATVIGVKGTKRRTILIQRDDFALVKGSRMSEHQEYVFSRNQNAPVVKVTFRQGAWRTEGGQVVSFGHRDCYTDPSF